jgi:drug/metabolite transporter (DMT)-like permease
VRPRLAESALFGVTVLWGLSFVVVKWALADSGFLALTALRMGLGLAVLVIAGRAAIHRASALEWKAGLLGGVVLTGGYLLQTAGLQTSSAAAGGFLTAFYVALTPVFEGLAFRRAPSLRNVLVLLLAAAGIVTMVAEEELRFAGGEALIAASAVMWAAQIVIVGRVAKRVSARRLAAIQVGTVALLSTAAFALSDEAAPRLTPQLMACVAYVGVVTCALCFLVQAWGQRSVSPTRAATLYAGEPVFAALFGVTLLGERFDATDWIGSALVMTAVVLTLRGPGPTGGTTSVASSPSPHHAAPMRGTSP